MMMKVRVSVDTNEIATIIKKTFINKKEFKALTGIESKSANALFNKFREKIKKELEAEGLCLPDTKHLPTNKVLKWLSLYGFDYYKPK